MLSLRWLSVWFVFALACGAPPPGSSEDAGVARDDAAVASDGGSGDGGSADGGSVVTRHDVLFVGNSYVYVNDVPAHYAAITRALYDRVRVEQVAPGGYRLEQHAADAASDATDLARWLRTGRSEETAFDAVVLQEQSQIGGFPMSTAERQASVAGARELAALATALGARVILYMTWGREHGDPSLSLLGYDTYEGMQDRLDEGYVGLAALLREDGADVDVAPVGGGFRLVYEDAIAAGEDPAAEGSGFDALFEPDGSHPSARGAYLASCIIAGRITGADVLGFGDEPALGAEVSGRLREVCARALVDPRWHVPTIHRSEGVLEGDGEMGGWFGASVAMASDGQRVLVGGPRRYPDSGAGLARVFVESGDGWTQEAEWLGGLRFASSVALSSDGARALVGPPSAVWSRSGTTWAEEAALPIDPSGAPDTPTELALSGDGLRAIVSTSGGALDTVLARVFVRESGAWVEEAALEAPIAGTAGSVGLDAEGRRAIVGAAGENAPRVFVRTDAGWMEEATLAAPGGTRVALAPDGSRAIVGAPGDGRAFVFARSGDGWSEVAVMRGPPYSFFGASVALSADRAFVGAPLDTIVETGPAVGSVRVYALGEGGARHELLLVPSVPFGGIAPPHFGASVAVSTDGTRVVVGAPHTDTSDGALYVGAAHVFTLP